jgi:hypothetical protein
MIYYLNKNHLNHKFDIINEVGSFVDFRCQICKIVVVFHRFEGSYTSLHYGPILELTCEEEQIKKLLE